MRKVVIASKNRDKIREIKRILNLSQIEILDFRDFEEFPQILEEGKTLKENAIHKAKTLAKWAKIPVLADDSGLEVDALGGAPGVRSARYAGAGCSYADNNAKLLREFSEYPLPQRKACFRCFAVYADLEQNLLVTEGVLKGHIAFEPRGKRGFGYDPIFIPLGYNKTLAELSLEEKNKISHRGQAFRKLKKLLEKLLGEQGIQE